MRRLAIVFAIVLVAGGALWIFRGPDPEEILARITVPPSPPRTPTEALEAFSIAPGFRIELVASEPLVVDPVAMDWDDEGRLYVVEMRGFMPTIDGEGEDQATGRVVVLEDEDRDGRMDSSRVFLDGLVLPRAITVHPDGVLIGAPPDLLLCRDDDRDGRCAPHERTRLGSYADGPGNVEHNENGLLQGLDGWIYNAKSRRTFRLHDGRFESRATTFRGQWGIAQDDQGRLYSNHNSGFLYVDLFPARYALRHPEVATRLRQAGLGVDLASDERVFGIRVAPGLNRAYESGTLRDDGRQNGPTGVSGLTIQRGDQFGPTYVGDAFVPEAAGAVVAHFALSEGDALGPQAEHVLYPDPTWEEREFLASRDERFRPVDVEIGPDGALWVLDMDRGVIQHAAYVSDYLRQYVLRHELEAPGETGRIWRVVREDRPIEYGPPPLATPDEWLAALDHPNGWVRDRAQRRLAHARSPEVLSSLERHTPSTPLGRVHWLWALEASDTLALRVLEESLDHSHVVVRRTALRLLTRFASGEHAERARALALVHLEDDDPALRLQAIHTLGALPLSARPIDRLFSITREGGEVERQAALSSLAGAGEALLDRALVTPGAAKDPEWIETMVAAAFLEAARGRAGAGDGTDSRGLDRESIARILARVEALATSDPALAIAVAAGIRNAQLRPGSERIVLPEAHSIFEREFDADLWSLVADIRRGISWPGDPNPGGLPPLDPEDEARRARGETLFAATCATCHGVEGRGIPGLAPALAGSQWVRDAEAWLARIVLHGVRGPIDVAGQTFEGSMPGHAQDPRFDDATLAGLMTFLRRSWGHAAAAVRPARVAAIRRESASRNEAWTVDELLALPVEHRLDRYTGIFGVPIVNIEFAIVREGPALTIGRRNGGRAPMVELSEGVFAGEGLILEFDSATEARPEKARVEYSGQRFSISRTGDFEE